jgi:hypothetical protein
MKRIKQIIGFVFVLCVIACNNKGQVNKARDPLNINEISIVISDVLWNGEVGDSLRKKFAAPVDGLTQEEPLFTLNQYHERLLDGSFTKGRNIIIVEKGSKPDFILKKNKYCSPQNIFTVKGNSIDELLSQIEMHSDEIIKNIRDTEILENQQRNKHAGLLDDKLFESSFNVSLQVPRTYKYALKNDGFLWLKKEIPSGNSSLLVYKVPFTVIEKNTTIVNNIITMRDSIGNMYIHGQEPGTFMITEEAYSPYLFTTSFQDKRAFETRGNWEMENDFMSGPFLNYAIKDDKNKCYLIIEGFIYSPSAPKRDLLIELESIIKSLKFL